MSPVAEGVQHSDDYVVIINDQLEKPSSVKAEHVNIRYVTNFFFMFGAKPPNK